MEQDAISSILERLESCEAQERRAMLKQLILSKGTDLKEVLIHVLVHDPNALLRSSAAKGLGTMQEEDAIPSLLDALSDSVNTVRAAAANALGKIRSPETAPALHKALGDDDLNVLSASIGALGKLLHPSSLPILLPFLEHFDEKVQRSTSKALRKYGIDPKDVVSQKKWPLSQEYSLEEKLLLDRLWSKDEHAQVKAAEAIGVGQNPKLLSSLVRSSGQVRTAAKSASQIVLSRSEPQEKFALLRSLLHESFPKCYLWLVLVELLDDWPEDELELALSYVESHIEHWPHALRVFGHDRLESMLAGKTFGSQRLVRAFHLNLGKELEAQQREQYLEWMASPFFQNIHQVTSHSPQLERAGVEAFLKHLGENHLETLSFMSPDIDFQCIEALFEGRHKLPSLKKLVFHCHSEDSTLSKMAESPALELISHLELGKRWDTEQSLAQLGPLLSSNYAKRLTGLSISSSWSGDTFNARDLRNLIGCPRLRELRSFSYSHGISHPEDFIYFVQNSDLQHLESFSIFYSPLVSMFLDVLAEQELFPNLRELSLFHIEPIGSESKMFGLEKLARWSGLGSLKKLVVSGSKTFEQIKPLLCSPHWRGELEELYVSRLYGEERLKMRRAVAAHPELHGVELQD